MHTRYLVILTFLDKGLNIDRNVGRWYFLYLQISFYIFLTDRNCAAKSYFFFLLEILSLYIYLYYVYINWKLNAQEKAYTIFLKIM